jgi:excinuclease ABC subunit C
LYERLPKTPGVYLMRGAGGKLLYIGKAANLQRRVSSYFTRPPSFAQASAGKHEWRIDKLVSEIRRIDHRRTDTALEALILEAELIKKHQPPFNVLEKDDTSFLYVDIGRGAFPPVLLARGKDPTRGTRFGPFLAAQSLREALKFIRRIFPFSVHDTNNTDKGRMTRIEGKQRRPCFDYQLGLCPGTCIGAISRQEYAKTIRHIKLFFEGKKQRVIRLLTREMRAASKTLDFERAETIRRQLFGLQHIQDIAFIKDDEVRGERCEVRAYRIEGYDTSNISGTSAVGSMVVFVNEKPNKNEYRKFRIKAVEDANPARPARLAEAPAKRAGGDTAMLREVLERRFKNSWPLPNLILVDGGIGQVNIARLVLRKLKLDIPVVGLAKGPERKRNDVVGTVPQGIELITLVRVRDEAHRFAIRYHRTLRGTAALT